MIKKLLLVITLCVILIAGWLYITAGQDYPPLQDGDLIFQTSTSEQSNAIMVATASPYIHVGIIKRDGEKINVIEARKQVTETPLDSWVNHGILKRVAIYRNPQLTPKQARDILSAAKKFYGKPYDIFFSFNNDGIYCSELPYLAYKSAGISIGTVQKVSDLNFDNMLVKNIIETRWQRYPDCQKQGYDFEQCYRYILNQDIVTPVSITKDDTFVKIYSNYPF